jgi:hypothetical protein
MRRTAIAILILLLLWGAVPASAAEGAHALDIRIPTASATHLDTQRVLTDLGFYRGSLDGRNTQELRASVLAFHKATGGELTSYWTNTDWIRAAMFSPTVSFDLSAAGTRARFAIDPLPEVASGRYSFMEIDLTNQVAYLVRDGSVEAVLGVSSGSEAYYRAPGGSRVKATTPRGVFTFYRRIDGLRRAPLGVLYRPWYFTGGYAVHGSPEVPAHPASHGCVRVTNWDADWLAAQLELGMVVRLHDGERATDLARQAPAALVVAVTSARLGADIS